MMKFGVVVVFIVSEDERSDGGSYLRSLALFSSVIRRENIYELLQSLSWLFSLHRPNMLVPP